MKSKLRIAIYSRKSKYTGKGDSIGNQIELSQEYIRMNYPNSQYEVETEIYEDEGFSGGNINRPQFQKFLEDERKSPYDVLICYRLDRISRSISDFSSLISELTKLNTNFISIKEQFDTKTPMGRAMMYIASVFAQLEREVIAERIRDNMLELSKTGIWLGGSPPIGFDSKRYNKVNICEENSDNMIENKVKTACKLVINEEEMKVVDLIFEKYMELKAISKVETFLIQNNIRTKKGAYFSTLNIRKVLTNLTYVKNDKDILEYFKEKGIHIYAEDDDRKKFNGKYGLMPYNKTSGSKELPIEDWIIAVGMHKGHISGKDYINVQTLIEKNADKKYRAIANSTKNTVMVGILKCKKCGSYMRPKNGGTKLKDGTISYYYSCTLKEKSRGVRCDSKNVKGTFIDSEIVNILKSIRIPNSEIYKELKKLSLSKQQYQDESEIAKLKKQYEKNKKEIESLINKLKYIDVSIVDLVNTELKKLKKQNIEIENKINNISKLLRDEKKYNRNLSKTATNILDIIDNCFDVFDKLDLKTKRDILSIFIESAYYNDETEKIEINLLNEKLEDSSKNFLISMSEKIFDKNSSTDVSSRFTDIGLKTHK